MRSAKTHLRTRVEKGGMNYKGFNIAVHEMGHNVEQTFSLEQHRPHICSRASRTLRLPRLWHLFFRTRDLELLGLAKPDAQSQALKTLNEFLGYLRNCRCGFG